MHIILGGTGHVGSATVKALLRKREPVTLVIRQSSHGKDHASSLIDAGAQVATADIRNIKNLRDIFITGQRALLLNPPADPSSDTDTEERLNMNAILKALEGSQLEKVVLASTYGARPGERCGDLTVLYEFEERLRRQSIPVAINRGAYYMSNWIGMADAVRASCKLPSCFPADLAIPMVAPEDLGKAAAKRLVEPVTNQDLLLVEGPERYTPQHGADAFSKVLSMPVKVEVVPREAWEKTFIQFGFSKEAAASYTCMTKTVVDKKMELPTHPVRGNITLREYIKNALAT